MQVDDERPSNDQRGRRHEEMSSQGSVNAPVAPQPPVVQQGTHSDGTDGSGRHPGRMTSDDDAAVRGSGTE